MPLGHSKPGVVSWPWAIDRWVGCDASLLLCWIGEICFGGFSSIDFSGAVGFGGSTRVWTGLGGLTGGLVGRYSGSFLAIDLEITTGWAESFGGDVKLIFAVVASEVLTTVSGFWVFRTWCGFLSFISLEFWYFCSLSKWKGQDFFSKNYLLINFSSSCGYQSVFEGSRNATRSKWVGSELLNLAWRSSLPRSECFSNDSCESKYIFMKICYLQKLFFLGLNMYAEKN